MRVAINGFGRIGKLVFRAFLEKNLKGADIRFDGVTVTGTENLLMAATLAEGKTTLLHVA